MDEIDYVELHTKDVALALSEHPDPADLGNWCRELFTDLARENVASKNSLARKLLQKAIAAQKLNQARTRKARIKRGLDVDELPCDDSVSGDDPQSGDGGGHEVESASGSSGKSSSVTPEASGREAEEGAMDSALCTSGVTVSISRKDARSEFEAFRKAFPGTRRGAEVEWENFSKKNFPKDVPLLMPALMREMAHKEECARVGAFVPEWANLSTWINQRRWTQELSTPRAPQVRKTSEDLENDRKAKMVQILKDREAGIPTGDDYDQMLDAECGGDDDA